MIYLGIYGRPLAPCWIIIDHSKQIDKLDQVAAGGAKVRVTTSMARNATDVSNRYPIDIGLNRKAATSLRQSSLFSFSKNAPAIKRKRAGKMDRVHRCIDPPYTPVIHTRYTHRGPTSKMAASQSMSLVNELTAATKTIQFSQSENIKQIKKKSTKF